MRLYKYLHPDRIDILKNLTIRFSSPKDLNDPFELKPSVKGLATSKELIDHLHQGIPDEIEKGYRKLPRNVRRRITLNQFRANASNFIPDAEQSMLEMASHATPILEEKLRQAMESEIGLLCLSEVPDSLLMWAHYADSHRGFLLEFDVDSTFFNQRRSENDEFGFLRSVRYQSSRPHILMSEMEAIDVFLTKGEDWRYEAEWRMLMPLSQATKHLEKPNETVHLFDLPTRAIVGITFGCRMLDSVKSEIQNFLINSDNLSHLYYRAACISDKEYKILFRPEKPDH